MIVLIHVMIALASVILTTFAYVRPSRFKLRGSYTLVALTLVSGFYLIWTTPSHMMRTCTTGLLYVTVVSVGMVLARQKLMAVENA